MCFGNGLGPYTADFRGFLLLVWRHNTHGCCVVVGSGENVGAGVGLLVDAQCTSCCLRNLLLVEVGVLLVEVGVLLVEVRVLLALGRGRGALGRGRGVLSWSRAGVFVLSWSRPGC
jgi:hypothetical protein